MKKRKSNKRWTSADAEYVRKCIGKVSLETMADELNRSEMSVRLYILRKRMSSGQLVKKNRTIALLEKRFKHPEDFTPGKAFYKETGIGQRRYWDLYFGRKAITGREYTAVAEYLGMTVTEAFEALELDLFDK